MIIGTQIVSQTVFTKQRMRCRWLKRYDVYKWLGNRNASKPAISQIGYEQNKMAEQSLTGPC